MKRSLRRRDFQRKHYLISKGDDVGQVVVAVEVKMEVTMMMKMTMAIASMMMKTIIKVAMIVKKKMLRSYWKRT